MERQHERPATASKGAWRRRALFAALASTMLSATVSPALAAHPVKGATYSFGGLGDRTQISFTVSRRDASLTGIEVATFSRCPNGREALALLLGDFLAPPARLRVSSAGTFSGTVVQDPELIDNPFEVSEQFSVSGRFIRRGKAARVIIHTQVVGEGGTVCDSGNRRVTAKRHRHRRPSFTG